MKWSESFTYTLKEPPSDAELISHQLLIRSGMIRKLASGLFTYGVMALRSIRKFEAIVRNELDNEGCCEILMPIVHPKELWDESGRWNDMGNSLARFKNRNGHEFCLGATHEEAVTDYVRRDIKSYRDLPVILYQVQTKFRDEIRPRFGLMRGREFIMKDAYSFDLNEDMAISCYNKMYKVYKNIFDRIGVDYRIVDADSGAIGGNKSQEFHIIANSGEDHLLISDTDSYAANIEVCPAQDPDPPEKSDSSNEKKLEKFETKGLKKISTLAKSLNLKESELVKTLFYASSDLEEDQDSSKIELKNLKPVCVLLRGSDELNPIKLKKALGLNHPPIMLTDKEVQQTTGAWPGSCGPVGLKIPVYMDSGVEHMKNIIVGANQDNYHLRNVNFPRDFTPTETLDLRFAKEGDLVPGGKGKLKSVRGIEVGHIFYLGAKYSQAMNAKYLDKNGKTQPIEMGCYGVGISRTVQAVIEQCHDKDGIIWPVSISPFQVHICHLDPEDEKVNGAAEEIYKSLIENNVEVFMDDRKERPGIKFKDADLLGFPLRIVIGKKGLDKGEIEVVKRTNKEKMVSSPQAVVDQIKTLLNEMK